jgi:4a-hydroxytetrahydrobiopterin dehydratase
MNELPLSEQTVVELPVGSAPLTSIQVHQYMANLSTEWADIDEQKINRTFAFQDFKQAMEFVNKVADLAETTQHHPDIHIYYGQVVIELWTHSVQGLSLNDFIMAAKIDSLQAMMQP